MKKKFLALVLTLAMVLSLVPVTAMAADTTQSNIQNPASSVKSEDGYVELEKTATAVEESDNTFEITLKATVTDGKAEGAKTSTDAVLVIDRSGSMNSIENGNRITPAQNAAKAFASVVLGEGANKQNKIAVVSYAESATTNTGLSSDLETVKNAINFSAYGGTNIQAGIKAARDILQTSRADNKVILVLSDGEPTYSFLTVGTATQTGCWEVIWHHSGTIDPDSVRITGFEYSEVVGTGRNYELEDGTTLSVTCKHGTYPENYTYYKDNGQPTIQEASYAKKAGYEIYSIYLGNSADTNAVSTMKGIATDNNHYKLATDASELGELFKGIAADITLPVVPGTVTDPMGDHMNLVADSLKNNSAVTTNDGGFTWDLTQVTPTNNEDGSRTYVLKYQITFDTDFTGFDATNFYPTNKETTLAYTVQGDPRTANFPIPKVKGKVATYQLTYNANGGKFGSDNTKTETIDKTGDHALNYTSEYTPTYTSEGKNRIFLGWSAEQLSVLDSTSNAAENAKKIITSVNVTDKGATVYAVWSLDENDNDIPDVFEATITYKIVNGQWTKDGEAISSADITATFQLYEQQSDHTWKATDKLLRDGNFPAGYTGTAGYTGLGWYRNSETTPSPSELVRPTTKVIDAVTGAQTVFTYKYAQTTSKTYTVVLHLEGGSYTTTPATYTKNSDGIYQYSVTNANEVINPESPSRNNFGFTGWSLSKNAPQTLIGENATFASLYLKQSGTSGSFDKIDLYAVWKGSEPSVTVNKKVETVGGTAFEGDKTVARQGDKIVWSVTVTNEKDTPAQVTLTDVMAAGVYTDVGCQTEASAVNWDDTAHSWTATVSPKGSSIYYVCYTVTQDDIPKGKIVNTIVMKNGEKEKTIPSDPVSTWDTKRLKSAISLNTSNWTTTVTLTLPTVNGKEEGTHVITSDAGQGTEVKPDPIAVKSGSYVIDQIGNEFTFVPELTLKVGKNEYTGVKDGDTNTYNFGTKVGEEYPYTVTYTAKNGDTPAQFTWNINEDVYAGTEVTLSYKLKLTTPKTVAGTYGVEDLNGSGQIEQAKALYTNESAILYKKEENTKLAEFPKPSVSYTIKGSSGGHGGNGGGTVTIPDDVPTGLNGKDHYAYVVGYPDGMVYPQKNITRAEVATIFFRLLTDETREANMTKSNSYNDMKDGAWYTCAVSTLSKMGIIKGYEDGSFKPDASISRAEFAAIAARFDPDGDTTPATFSDVSSHWAKDEISIAANHGWIKGYEDGSFKPDQKITRAETMTLVNRVLKRLPETKDDLHKDMKTWPDNQNESAWFYLAVQEATNSHYQKLKKDGTHEKWESMRETRDWAALEK